MVGGDSGIGVYLTKIKSKDAKVHFYIEVKATADVISASQHWAV